MPKTSHQGGLTEREYGKLGEVVKETRTLGIRLPQKTYSTGFSFDTFGRLLKLTYPDGEVLRNEYDSGGNLRAIEGDREGERYFYLKQLHYDKFEQRAFAEYGNGVTTTFAYRPDNRRLSNLTSSPAQGDPFQKLEYTYDAVGNVKTLNNPVAVTRNRPGGPFSHSFGYDKLHRLVTANGGFTPREGTEDTYSLSMGYYSIHNITRKTQKHAVTRPSGKVIVQKGTNFGEITTSDRPHYRR